MSSQAHQLEQMRAISHPARWRMLEVLWSGRTLTATQAAAIAGITPSAMSYHMRQLAKLGFIEPVDSPDGRERPWRAATPGPELTVKPDNELGTTMMQNLLHSLTRTLTAPPPLEGENRPWPAAFSHGTLRLTPSQRKEMHGRIRAMIEEYERDQGEADDSTVYDVYWIMGAQHLPEPE